MATPLSQILSYQSIDLMPYEIRGVKPGIGNANTTGPVYVDGTYFPSVNILTGSCFLDSTDSSNMAVTGFDPPYASLNALSLRQNDLVMTLGATYTVNSVIDATSVFVDRNFDSTSVTIVPCTFQMGQRDYLFEPDPQNNDSFGLANFTKNSATVTGHGTNWASQLLPGDSIKNDYYQYLYKIGHVTSNTQLTLTSPYSGDSTVETTYTAKRTAIGREAIDYVKDNFSYDNKSGRWTYDATTGNDITTSLSFLPFVDGIELAFTKSLSSTSPDLVETALALNVTLAQSTTYDTFQFPMPKVPHPETMQLYLNGSPKSLDQYPKGHRDYVLNYTQNPMYEFPPPPAQRQVCNIMFLKGVSNMALSKSSTVDGLMQFVDATGKSVREIMPGSEVITADGTAMVANRDFLLEPMSGTAVACDYNVGESLVKYVSINLSDYVDNGFAVYLNGVPQKISFPASPTDDILFQPYNGRLKPANQDKPGPGDSYEIHYMVEANPVSSEPIKTVQGATSFRTTYWPVKVNSSLLTKDGNILSEGVDFIVSYQTGIFTLTDSTISSLSQYLISYTPLSKQVNTLSYKSPNWFCTAQDSRLAVSATSNFTFQITNTNLNLSDASSMASILRVYNETRDKDYNLSGLTVSAQTIKLAADSTNTAIGLSPTDVVVADYKFASETTEYAPVVVANFIVPAGSNSLIVEGVDVSHFFKSNAIVSLTSSSGGATYNFVVISASYDGLNTTVALTSSIPADIVNPTIIVSDDPVTFVTVPQSMSPAMSGSMSISFPGTDMKRLFRPNTLMDMGGGSIHTVSNAIYDGKNTVVSLLSPLISDVTSPSALANIRYSDCPVYPEGTVDVAPKDPALSLLPIPGLILSYTGFDTISVTTDSSKLTINGVPFPYLTYPTLGDMSSAIDASTTSMAVATFAPLWPSRKIVALEDVQYLYNDSSVVLAVLPELRFRTSSEPVFDGTDSTNYEITPAGGVTLTNGLAGYQRYDFDYLGQRFLGTSQIAYSANYFTKLPKKTKVVASFEYDNLDQFYIQVLSQRDFFGEVTIPRMTQEAQQLNGNVGQGGRVAGDTASSGPSEGGLTDNLYRLKDAQIECRIFETIYEFFSGRVAAYGQEYLAALGLRIFNNDGVATEAQLAMSTNPGNNSRLFPDSNYTKYEPERVNPLTGEFRGTASFTNGGGVQGSGTLWTKQLSSNDFIGRADSTKRYEILNVLSDSSVQLTVPYAEASATTTFSASALYPAYDDDGNMGAKIIGTKGGNFGLSNGPTFDTFNATIDGITVSHTFKPPTDPIMALFFGPSTLSADQVATVLTNDFNAQLGSVKFKASVESVTDPDNIWRKTVLVLRTVYPANTITLGTGSAVSKLGFTPGTSAMGNFNPAATLPEFTLLQQERVCLLTETTDLQTLWNVGIPDKKMNRISPSFLSVVLDVFSQAGTEASLTNTEIQRLNTEIAALSILMEEPSLPTYGDATAAYGDATVTLPLVQYANGYDSYVNPSWEGKGTDWRWVLDWSDGTQTILGRDSNGNGVDTTVGVGVIPIDGETAFNLLVPPGHDIRIMDATVFGTFYTPNVYYQDTSSFVDGTWTGWDTTAAFSNANAMGQYSHDNTVSFTMDNSTPLFYIGLDPVSPSPFYQTSATTFTLTWHSSYGDRVYPFPYASYQNVGSISTILSELPGFMATPLCSPGYDYTSMDIQTVGIGPYPGTTVSTGAGSPAFSMWYDSTYSAGVTSLIVGLTTLPYVSYPTLGALQAAVSSLQGYSVPSYYAPDCTYSTLLPASGTVSSTLPGTTLFFNSDIPAINLNFTAPVNPAYLVDSTSVQIIWTHGGDQTAVLHFVDYPMVGDMVDAISALTGFIAAPITNRTYPYGHINQVPYTPLSAFPTILSSDRDLFSIAFAINGTYQATPTGLQLSYSWGASSYTVTKNYSSYLTLQDLVTGISAETYFSAGLVNALGGSYNYSYLKSAGLSPLTSTQLFLHPNSPAMEILSYNPTFSSNATALTLNLSGGSPRIFNYLSYPALHDLEVAISAIPGFSVAGIYDGAYHYGYLESTSGTLSHLATSLHFSVANPAPLFNIFFEIDSPSYTIDQTAMNLMWTEHTSPMIGDFRYSDYPSIGDMKNALNLVPGMDATGDLTYDSSSSRAFQIVTDATSITLMDSTVYPGLRPCFVTYSTITDRILSDRTSFVNSRIPQVDGRINFLSIRNTQIHFDLGTEQLLRTNTGDVGDLWTWANYRFNRRQGTEARLSQVEAQMSSNQSALLIDKSLTQ